MRIQLAVAVAVLCSSTTIASAAKNAELKPVLVSAAKVSLEDDFDRAELGKKWLVGKGEWKIVDGCLVGKELKADKHAAVVSLQQKNRDSVVRLSFRLNGPQGFHFSLNYAKGHLFRVIVTPKEISLRTDKDKKDPASKSELLAKAEKTFKPNEWYTMLVEMQGDKVVVQTDNGVKLTGQHPSLDTDKPNYRLVTRGDSLQIDDIKVSLQK